MRTPDGRLGLALRRRADGSRGWRARRAWRAVVRACGEGDAAVQTAVRGSAGDLSGGDVLDLLAVAPEQPADRAAYLALIGQDGQRRALDPDGSLLALAYRAGTGELRERLRHVLAGGEEAEVVRAVVTGERRDRVAELTSDELDYLGHQLAAHQSWDDLRRLALDVPVAEAAALARLLPERERAGRSAASLAALAERDPAQLRATVARLPRDELIEHGTDGVSSSATASFSPDSSELAVQWHVFGGVATENRIETLRIGTGDAVRCFSHRGAGYGGDFTVLHLGDELLIGRKRRRSNTSLYRVTADGRADRYPPSDLSEMRWSSRGAVLARPQGLVFVDREARSLRYRDLPWLREAGNRLPLQRDGYFFGFTTSPSAGLIAFYNIGDVLVLDEEGKLLHRFEPTKDDKKYRWCRPVLSFLSPNRLALHRYSVSLHRDLDEESRQRTEIWELPPDGEPRCVEVYQGHVLSRRPLGTWRGLCLDEAFARRILTANALSGAMNEGIVPRPLAESHWFEQRPLGVSPWGDMIVTTPLHPPKRHIRVHSPRLPSARALLERPLLQHTPLDVPRARELRAEIGDPEVRSVLELLAECLDERFADDIALGANPLPTGNATDIALGDEQEK